MCLCYQPPILYNLSAGVLIAPTRVLINASEKRRGVCDTLSMGYSSIEDQRNVAAAFEMFPLAFALSTADSEATYFIESKKNK